MRKWVASWLLGLVVCTLPSTPWASGAKEEGPPASRVVLQGVDHYRVVEPMFESVRVVLSYRGESYSPAYIQGISGAAFRIGGPCPCAPTCESAMQVQDLLPLLGYQFEWAPLSGEGVDPGERYQKLLERIKGEIRAGRPVIVWNAFTTAEWDVVCGFDEEKKEFHGRGSYPSMRVEEYARADWMRPGRPSDVAPLLGVIFVGEKTEALDAPLAELVALREAVAHARRRHGAWGAMPVGLNCYDQWIAAYRNRGWLVKAKTRVGGEDLGLVHPQGPKDFYPLQVLPSTRQAAAEFMRELASEHPRARAHLEMAAEHFRVESKALERCGQVLGDRSQEPSDEQCVLAAGFLSQARAMYALAIEEIEQALLLMENPR